MKSFQYSKFTQKRSASIANYTPPHIYRRSFFVPTNRSVSMATIVGPAYFVPAKYYSSSFGSNFKSTSGGFPLNQHQQKFGLERLVDVELLQKETPQSRSWEISPDCIGDHKGIVIVLEISIDREEPKHALALHDLLQSPTQSPNARFKITSIWVQYHHKKPCISAVVPSDTFEKLKQRYTKCPMFIFPMPKPEQGFYFMLSQMKPFDKTCIFTPLSEFQQQGANAPHWLKMTYYTELQDSKGLVLMRGEVDTTVLTTQSAQFLANLWQIYHLDDSKYKRMETFNHEPSKFDYNELVNDLDTIGDAAKLAQSPTEPTDTSKSS